MAQVSSLILLNRLRGLAYETLGDFEYARADLETALDLAQANSDREGEWRLLLDLGQLWAWRDYDQTGDYFRQALQLARTLNRVGNWYLAVDQLHEANFVELLLSTRRPVRKGRNARHKGLHALISPKRSGADLKWRR